MSSDAEHNSIDQGKSDEAASASEQPPAGSSIKELASANVSSSSSSSTSYVYPVRSLLSGIQPAATDQSSPLGILGAIGAPLTAKSMSQAAAQFKREKGSKGSSGRGANPSLSDSSIPLPMDPLETPLVPLSGGGYFSQPIASTSKESDVSSPDSLTPQAETKLERGLVKSEKTVSAVQKPGLSSSAPEGQNEATGQGILIRAGDRDPDEYDPRHPEPISSAGADAITNAYTTPSLKVPKPMQATQSDEPSHSKPIDFSHSGIVHLPSISSQGGSERGSSLSGGSLVSSRKPRDNLQSPFSGSGSDPWGKRSAGDNQSGLSGTDSAGDVARDTPSSTNMSSSSELVTFKFEHVVDEDGFHVITGREGVLIKCEDEVRNYFFYSIAFQT